MADDSVDWAALDPADWQHTPPLAVYRELEKQNPRLRLFWRIDAGHALNLLDEATDLLERVEKLAGDLEQQADHEPYGGELWSTTAAALRAALAGEGE